MGGLFPVEIVSVGRVPCAGGGLGTVDAGAPFDNVDVELEDALLAEHKLGDGNQRRLRALAEDGSAGSEKEIFDELLGEGRASADAAAFLIIFGGNFDGVPVEAVMLIEATVLGGDDGVLEIGRDLAEGDELVTRVVGLAVNPGLHAALDVDDGGGRIDPAEGDEGEGGEGPEYGEGEEEAAEPGADGGSATDVARRFRGGRGWAFRHTSG